ncbi:MAG: hypothetical protein ACREM3_31175 [Candidatus Rokuibacteriota bacterium]
MGDSWLQKLVVRGPISDVVAFRKAAASGKQPEYWTMDPQSRTLRLSFAKLRDLLPPQDAGKCDADPEEPADLVVEHLRKFRDRSVELTYRFQLAESEPDALIIAVSKAFPRLCFVVGCVAPSVDEQSSCLIHNGRSWRWRLSGRQKKAILATVTEETEENGDEVALARAEADWAMMDEVIDDLVSSPSRLLRGA